MEAYFSNVALPKFQQLSVNIVVVKIVKTAAALISCDVSERNSGVFVLIVVGAEIIVAQNLINRLAAFTAKSLVVLMNTCIRAEFTTVVTVNFCP